MSDSNEFTEIKKRGRPKKEIKIELSEEEKQLIKEKKAESNKKYYKSKNPDAGLVKRGRKPFLTAEEIRARDNARVKRWLEKKKLESKNLNS